MRGLAADMMSMVRNAKPSTLKEAIEEAKVMEDVYARDKLEKSGMGEKRKWESPQNSFKKSRFNPSGRGTEP